MLYTISTVTSLGFPLLSPTSSAVGWCQDPGGGGYPQGPRPVQRSPEAVWHGDHSGTGHRVCDDRDVRPRLRPRHGGVSPDHHPAGGGRSGGPAVG